MYRKHRFKLPGAAFIALLFIASPGSTPALSITRGPYLQNLTPNTVTVVWVTDTASNSRVDYGLSASYSNTATDSASVTQHAVVLTGLAEASIYHYQVYSGGAALTGDLTLHSGKGAGYNSFMFVAMGDHRTNIASHTSVAQRVQAIDPEFIVDVGDLVYYGDTASEWDPQFFGPETQVMSRACMFTCIGNHEQTGALYLNYFYLPTSVPGGERYYSFNYANAHFTVLDNYTSYAVGSPQYNWLVSDLAANQSKDWRFVIFHQPPYSSGTGHGSDLLARSTLCPVLEQYKVHMVFNGHDHDYERSYVNGIHYVVTGGGGAPLKTVGTNTWTQFSLSSLQCCKITINGRDLSFQSINPAGTVIDSLQFGVPVSLSEFMID